MMESASGSEGEPGDLLEQFRKLVKAAGGTGAAGQLIGVPKTTLDGYFAGKSRIPLEPVVRLAKVTNMSLDEMMLGSGLIGRSGAPENAGFVPIPMLALRASAGPGQIAMHPEPEGGEVVSFREEWLRRIGLVPNRTEAMTAIGDSMEPTIRDGDLLLVDRSVDRVVNHGIYIVVYHGAVHVKRVQMRIDGSLVLKSDNAVYSEEVVPAYDASALIIEGRVRWFGRMI